MCFVIWWCIIANMRVSADVLDAQSGGDRNAVELLGRLITPEIVRQVIQKASAVNWGAHFLRWRYFDVTHAGRAYHRGTLVATALWHLLKRIYVDQDWPADTTLDQLNADARATIQAGDTEIWCYGIIASTRRACNGVSSILRWASRWCTMTKRI
ncbi:hypothetical protein [Candidatus Amarolinea dominans]|uniref:hypothetical protein n=1 Tax=Candidatus Amarolinea dominans TaxID=3140696 RepID=UPI00313700F0|nr:hypothetical protein [Anaerolineae bacterium]